MPRKTIEKLCFSPHLRLCPPFHLCTNSLASAAHRLINDLIINADFKNLCSQHAVCHLCSFVHAGQDCDLFTLKSDIDYILKKVII